MTSTTNSGGKIVQVIKKSSKSYANVKINTSQLPLLFDGEVLSCFFTACSCWLHLFQTSGRDIFGPAGSTVSCSLSGYLSVMH